MNAIYGSGVQKDLPDELVRRVRRVGAAGIDVETDGLDITASNLQLVQVAADPGIVVIIRPNRWDDATQLRALLLDSTIQKVFHYALFDGPLLRRHLGVSPVNMYCTKIASKILTPEESDHTLRRLLALHCGVTIDKSLAASDWSQPLTAQQLTAAADDARWLVQLRDRLQSEFYLLGVTGQIREQMNRACQECLPTLIDLRLAGLLPDRRDPRCVFDY